MPVIQGERERGEGRGRRGSLIDLGVLLTSLSFRPLLYWYL